MKAHRWTHPTPRVRSDGERIERGDVFRPTEHERRCWPDRMVEAESCPTVIATGDNAGDVCGRDVPCPYHSGDD